MEAINNSSTKIENPSKTETSKDKDDNKLSLRGDHVNSGSLSGVEKAHGSDAVDALASQLHKVTISNQILSSPTIDGIAKYMKNKLNLKVITMVGAGISTAAGIPDFRSPGTGLYHNLSKYKLPYPHAIFELNYFMKNPEPFYQLASHLLPGSYFPTISHSFIKLLEEKGVLLRHYTQNIDNLDRLVGISEDKIVEAHGTFYKSHCLKCQHEYGINWLKRQICKKGIPYCMECGGLVKPDITFFGENLPKKFFDSLDDDFDCCDLLIIMGSSLEVEPFASLALRARKFCPRLMINLTPVGKNIGFKFNRPNNSRDVLWIGECDAGCQLLAEKLGWGEDLLRLYSETKRNGLNSDDADVESSC